MRRVHPLGLLLSLPLSAGAETVTANAADTAWLLTATALVLFMTLPGLALSTDSSALTCIGNDFGYDQVFSRQVSGLAQKGDLVVVLGGDEDNEEIFEVALGGVECLRVAVLEEALPPFAEGHRLLAVQHALGAVGFRRRIAEQLAQVGDQSFGAGLATAVRERDGGRLFGANIFDAAHGGRGLCSFAAGVALAGGRPVGVADRRAGCDRCEYDRAGQDRPRAGASPAGGVPRG